MTKTGMTAGRTANLLLVLLGLALDGNVELVKAQTAGPYSKPGQVLPNFSLYTRRRWTNDNGQVFAPGSRVRLNDLAGHVLFLEFFDPT